MQITRLVKSVLLLFIGGVVGAAVGAITVWSFTPSHHAHRYNASFMENVYWQKFFYDSFNVFLNSESREVFLSEITPGPWDEACLFFPGEPFDMTDLSGYKILSGETTPQNDAWALVFKDNKHKTAWFIQNPSEYSRTRETKTNQCFNNKAKVAKILEDEARSKYLRVYLRK